jgi:hypothetical protein
MGPFRISRHIYRKAHLIGGAWMHIKEWKVLTTNKVHVTQSRHGPSGKELIEGATSRRAASSPLA